MSVALRTSFLLAASNVFMTFAWYAHLKNLSDRPWYVAALVSWGIASFEYLIQVRANRLGHTQMTVSQLKIMQEVITLSVFAPHERAAQMGLPLGRSMLAGSCVFHVSLVTHPCNTSVWLNNATLNAVHSSKSGLAGQTVSAFAINAC